MGKGHDIESALKRVLGSPEFATRAQLRAFLEFVVRRVLEGEPHRIKGYTIATEAFGRAPDFDPQSDAIVRVEAGRLRQQLDLYYGGSGADDPLRIILPKGTYVPIFEARSPDGSSASGERDPRSMAIDGAD